MANITTKPLVPSKFLENSQATQYTATNTSAIIDKCTVTNTGAVAAKFSINLITTGSAATSNLIIKDQSVAAGAVYLCPEIVAHTLGSGGAISTIADTADVLVIRISGREIV